MKKLMAAVLIITVICSGTAYAEGPTTEEQPAAEELTIAVTVEDITAVSEQLAGYETEMDMLARLVWSEARGVDNDREKAAVIWCVLNRVDAGYGTIPEVIKAPHQFAYRKNAPVSEELRELAKDVLTRWLLEKRGITDVGRILPASFLYFAERGGHNRYRLSYRGRTYWDWLLPDPYKAGE